MSMLGNAQAARILLLRQHCQRFIALRRRNLPSQADERCLGQFIDCVTPARLHTSFAKACLAEIIRRRDELMPLRLPGASREHGHHEGATDAARPGKGAVAAGLGGNGCLPPVNKIPSGNAESDGEGEGLGGGMKTRSSSSSRPRRSHSAAQPATLSMASAPAAAVAAPVLPARLHLRSAESTASEAASLLASTGFVPGLATRLGAVLARIAADEGSPAALAVAALDTGKPRAFVAQAIRVMRPLLGSRQGAGAVRLPASVAQAFVSPFGKGPVGQGQGTSALSRSSAADAGPDSLGMPPAGDPDGKRADAHATAALGGAAVHGSGTAQGPWWAWCGQAKAGVFGLVCTTVTIPLPILALLVAAAALIGSLMASRGALMLGATSV